MRKPTNWSAFKGTTGLIAIAALVLLLLSSAQIIYRLTLPTDGWAVYTTDLEKPDWIYDANLVRAPSGLQTDDNLLSIDGVSVEGGASLDYLSPPASWQAGEIVTAIVRRGDLQLALEIPVVRWTGAALWRYNIDQLDQLSGTFGALLFMAVTWFAFLRRPDLPSARALLILSTAIGAAFISGILPDGLSVQFNWLAFVATGFFSYIIFGTLVAPSLLTFSLLFPRPKEVIQRRPWLALMPFGLGLLLLLYLIGGGAATVAWAAAMVMIIAAFISLIHAGFTQRDVVSRAQLRWAISSFALGLGLFLLNYPIAFGWVTDPLMVAVLSAPASLSFAVIGVGLAVAVLRYRLWDIDVIIRKTLIYAVLTGLLALVYLGSVVLSQSIVETISGQESTIGIVISTLIIAALFAPLRQRIQGFIDRRFYRRKYDADQTLTQFARTAREEVELESLKAELVRVVHETMQPEQVSLWLPEHSTRRTEV